MAFRQGVADAISVVSQPHKPEQRLRLLAPGRGLQRADHRPQAVFRSERQHHIVNDALVGEQLRNLEGARYPKARNRSEEPGA